MWKYNQFAVKWNYTMLGLCWHHTSRHFRTHWILTSIFACVNDAFLEERTYIHNTIICVLQEDLFVFLNECVTGLSLPLPLLFATVCYTGAWLDSCSLWYPVATWKILGMREIIQTWRDKWCQISHRYRM